MSNKIRVTMSQNLSTTGAAYVMGQSYDLDPQEAARFVRNGIASSEEEVPEIEHAPDGPDSIAGDHANAGPLVNLPTSLHVHATNQADGQRLPSNFQPPIKETDSAATDPAANPASTGAAPAANALPPGHAAPRTGNPAAAARAAAARSRTQPVPPDDAAANRKADADKSSKPTEGGSVGGESSDPAKEADDAAKGGATGK